MSNENEITYFFNEKKEVIGNRSGILPISLYKGMKISLHPYNNEYEVVDWNFHAGHPDEKGGLRIFLKETPTKAAYLDFKV